MAAERRVQVTERILRTAAPIATQMGCTVLGVEYLPGAGGSLVRVYLDREGGVSLDDCVRVSRQLSGALDVQAPLRERYSLEVSSPGIERPLFEREHFERFVGEAARIRLFAPLAGRRTFNGLLRGVRGEEVVLETAEAEFFLPLERIQRAHLTPPPPAPTAR